MIKDIMLASIIITLITFLLFGVLNELSFVYGQDIDSSEYSKFSTLHSSVTNSYADISNYVYYSKNTVDNVNVSPEQAEGKDIVSVLGRYAVAIVKILSSVFTVPVEMVSSISIALGLNIEYSMVVNYVISLLMLFVILEILSISIRYPVDR